MNTYFNNRSNNGVVKTIKQNMANYGKPTVSEFSELELLLKDDKTDKLNQTIHFNGIIAVTIFDKLKNFLSKTSKKIDVVNVDNVVDVFNDDKQNIFYSIYGFPDFFQIKNYKKLSEIILHGDFHKGDKKFYSYKNNIGFCCPSEDEGSIRIKDNLIFKFLQSFIFKNFNVYLYDASKIITEQEYEQATEDFNSSYIGIYNFCEKTVPSVIFSKTKLELTEIFDNDESEYYLWFEQPDNSLTCPSEYAKFFKFYDEHPMFIEFKNQKKINTVWTYVNRFFNEKPRSIIEIEQHLFYGNLTNLSLEDSKTKENLENKYNIEFVIDNSVNFQIRKLKHNSKAEVNLLEKSSYDKHEEDKNLKNASDIKINEIEENEETERRVLSSYNSFC
jgi:hypothetical protein